MTVTDKLLRVYRVDRQIDGLKGRLRVAERFLNEQLRTLDDLSARAAALDTQLRQMKASMADAEGEAEALDAKVNELRERMGNAANNREYQALLTEVNTFKDQKTAAENRAVSLLEQIESITTERSGLVEQIAEREKMRAVAITDRGAREAEIADKLGALEHERSALIEDVPNHVLGTYVELVDRLGDEAMAPIEIQDRKRHEFTCGACMMSVPIESMNALLGHGNLTTCVSCGAIMYLDEATRERMTVTPKR
jgi:uncharacterized protein